MKKFKRKKKTTTDIKRDALIKPADIERAKKAWARDAPKRFRNLLLAKPDAS